MVVVVVIGKERSGSVVVFVIWFDSKGICVDQLSGHLALEVDDN